MSISIFTVLRRLSLTGAALCLLLGGSAVVSTPGAPAAPPDAAAAPAAAGLPPLTKLYRLFNGHTGDHFYTIDKIEAEVAQSNGYRFEWVEGWVPTVALWPQLDLVPLHRLYNPDTGDHFYTTNFDEALAADNNGGYRYEWIEATVLSPNANAPYFVPLHRLYNPNTGDHLYTTKPDEKKYAESVGYRYEGIACKVVVSA